ncbi:MAG: hypothetical protein WBC44_13760 [Planctomycetaceae bacterium]
MNCPYCGSDDLATVQRRTGLIVRQCNACRLRFPAADEDAENLAEESRDKAARRRRKAA